MANLDHDIRQRSCKRVPAQYLRNLQKGNVADVKDEDFMRSSDLVLCFGPHHSSANTYGYSGIPDPAVTVSFTASKVQSGGQIFRDLSPKHFLEEPIRNLDHSELARCSSYLDLCRDSAILFGNSLALAS